MSKKTKSKLNQISLNKAQLHQNITVFIQSKDMTTKELINEANNLYSELRKTEPVVMETEQS